MNRHLTPILRVADHILGQTVPPKQDQPAEPAWQPATVRGYEQRMVNGKLELRPVPGSLPEEPKKASFADREQAAFEDWIDKARPSGDAESVQYQWMRSAERAEFIDEQTAEAA